MFETLFNEMLETITKGFSNTQKSFLRFALWTVYEEKTKDIVEVLCQCEMNEITIDEEETAKLKDELRAQFLLLPLYTTKTREEILTLQERQQRLQERWKALAQSKGIE